MVAYPSYQNYVRKGKRTDAKDALLSLQMAQEKYRANQPAYGTLAQVGVATNSPNSYYTIAIVGTPDGTSFVATATATPATGDQYLHDKQNGTSCAVLTLTVNSTSPSGAKTPAVCW